MPTHLIKKSTQRKNFALSLELSHKVNKTAKELNMKLTQLIKIAVEEYLEKKEKEKLEKEIIENCKFYYSSDKETASDWVVAEAKIKKEK